MGKLDTILYQAEAFKKQNWLLSKHILENALKDFPNEKILYMELGDILTSQKIYKKANEYYIEALNFCDNQKEKDDLLYKIATNFLNIKEYPLAINFYEKINEKTPEIKYNIAYAYLENRKYLTSLDILFDLIKQKNITQIPYLLISEIYYSMHQDDKALDYLDQAEERFGETAAIFYLKASIYANKKHWLQAVTYYKKSENLDIGFPNFYRNYAIALYNLGKKQKAIKYLKKNIEYDSKDATSYFYILKILTDLKKYKEAKKYLEKAKKNIDIDNNKFINAFEITIELGIKSK